MSNSEAREYIDFELKKRNDKQPSNTGTSLVKLVANLYILVFLLQNNDNTNDSDQSDKSSSNIAGKGCGVDITDVWTLHYSLQSVESLKN